jgi:hypothetical protein
MEAMRHTRNHPVLGRSYVKELDHISPKAYHQLLDYHWRCCEAAVPPSTNFDWIPKGSLWVLPECKKCTVGFGTLFNMQLGAIYASKCCTTYVKVALKTRPSGASVRRPDFVNDALKEASKCADCSESAIDEFKRFIDLFAKEIERVTLAVRHQIISEFFLTLIWIGRTTARLRLGGCRMRRIDAIQFFML